MDMIIIIGAAVVVLILIVTAIVLSMGNKKKPARKKVAGKLVEIDPQEIVNRIFKLAPSDLKKAKLDYIGKRFAIRTIMTGSKISKRGDTYREVFLDFQGNRHIHISGDVNMNDYPNQDWMTKEGKLIVSGIVRDIQPKEWLLEDIKII